VNRRTFVADHLEPVAVMLDFVHPAGARRRLHGAGGDRKAGSSSLVPEVLTAPDLAQLKADDPQAANRGAFIQLKGKVDRFV
jgi:hypothetical protein